jgi:hypothetical protein
VREGEPPQTIDHPVHVGSLAFVLAELRVTPVVEKKQPGRCRLALPPRLTMPREGHSCWSRFGLLLNVLPSATNQPLPCLPLHQLRPCQATP